MPKRRNDRVEQSCEISQSILKDLQPFVASSDDSVSSALIDVTSVLPDDVSIVFVGQNWSSLKTPGIMRIRL